MGPRDGEQQMREVRELLLAWDPLGVAGEVGADDEYDRLIGPLARLVREKAPVDTMTAMIERSRADHFGLDPDPGADRMLADALVGWWRERSAR